jgi:hypothetical protein
MKRWAVLLCALWAVAGAAQEATYVVRGDPQPITMASNGYVQSVTSGSNGESRVHVATTLGPIGSEGSYAEIEGTRHPQLPDDFELPPKLQSDLRQGLTAWEAATRVLEWAAGHVRIEPNDELPQDALAVLERGWGRCSGLANATTALLLAAGFEAVTVSGLLITQDGAIPHRWVACRLPVAGWVPTDPTLGPWAVTPGHVTFADTVESPPEVMLVETGGDALDRLPRRNGRPFRPNLGSDLVCRLVGATESVKAVAILHSGVEEHRAVLDPEGRFSALLPGRWRLVVMADGEVVEDRLLELKAGQVHSFTVSMASARSEPEVGS